MRLSFNEEIDLPVEHVYSYFRSPHDWQRLYGSFGIVQALGEGWFAVPLRRFPFPLVARITSDEPQTRVAWELKGFWRGTGELTFTPTPAGVRIQGYEAITIGRWNWLSWLLEKLLLEKRFAAVWASGWRRLRREAAGTRASHDSSRLSRLL